MKRFKIMLGLVGAGLIGGILFIYLGVFNVAADEPHSKPFYWLMETVRQRSIAMRARGVEVPPLGDPALITSGGADFNEMCTGCHLQPGVEESEMASAMYPHPPNLTQVKRDNPAETFWIIKHGLKMSGMPAWGATHDDARMWAMVAFLQQLPRLTPAQYQILTARSEGDMGGHAHGGGEPAGSMEPMPGMDMKPEPGDGHGGHEHGAAAKPEADAQKGIDMKSEPDSGAGTATAAAESFHQALSAGDLSKAAALLDPQVLIYEVGAAEHSREEYAAQHMKDDAAFLKTAGYQLLRRSGDSAGNLAWMASEVRITDQAHDKDLDLVSTETMVLRKAAGGWRIAHIHWASQNTKPAAP